MNVTPQQYAAMQKRNEPKSNSKVNIPMAFLTGGLICVVGQLLLEGFLRLGLDRQVASGWVSVTLVACSAILTGFGLYERLARHAGAGTLVPITGFANAVAAPAIEYSTEGRVLGTAVKMFTIAGPVIVFGTAAAWIYGCVYYFFLR